MLVLVVETLLDPLGVADVGEAQGLSAAEQDAAAVDGAGGAPLGAGGGGAGVRDMTELVEVEAVDLDAGAGEEAVAVAARLGVTQVQQVGRVELELGHRLRGQEDVIGLLAAVLLHAADVVVLGIGLQLNEQLPARGVGRQEAGRGVGLLARGEQATCRLVPGEQALGGRRGDVLGELEVHQIGTRADAAGVLDAVAHAGQGQEGHLIDAVGQPVGEHIAGVFAEGDDGLLVGHATFVAVGVTDLVDTDDLIEGLHRLFVAFQGAVTGNAVAFEVGQQGDDCAGALLRLLQLGDVLDDAVGVGAGELVDEGVVAGLAPQVFRPRGLLLVGEQGKVSQTHSEPPLC